MRPEQKTTSQHIAVAVRQARKAASRTVKSVATALGMSDRVYAAYESGTKPLPAALLLPIARELGVSVAELLCMPAEDEIELLNVFRKLPTERRRHILRLTKTHIPAD